MPHRNIWNTVGKPAVLGSPIIIVDIRIIYEKGTAWVSFDGGKCWPIKRQIFEGRFAYSSVTAGFNGTPSEGNIYCHFEGGPSGASSVAIFNLSWLLGGEKTGNGTVPKLKID